MNLLQTALHCWQDFDYAEHTIGICLGIFAPDSSMSDYKGVFWSNNPLGNALTNILFELVEADILEESEEGQFRWKGWGYGSERKCGPASESALR